MEGIKEGIQKGMIETAKLSILQGIDSQTISSITKMDMAEIEAIKEDVLNKKE